MDCSQKTRRHFLKCLAAVPLAGPALATPGLLEQVQPGPSPASSLPTDFYLDKPLEYWLKRLRAAKDRRDLLESREAVVCFGAAAAPPLLNAIATEFGARGALLVESLAMLGKPAIAGLLDMLDHRSPCLRAAACMGIPEALDRQWELTDRQDETLADVLWALEGGSKAALKGAFDEAAMAFAAAEMEKRPGIDILASVISRLEDPVPAVRIAATEALGAMDCAPSHRRDVKTALSYMLDDAEEQVRHAAAESLHLRALPDRESSERSEEACSKPRCRPWPRRKAAVLEKRLAHGGRGPGEAAQVTAHRPPEERAAAARALGSAKTPSEVQVRYVIGLLQDSDMAVRCAAAAALGGKCDEEANIGWHLWLAMKDPCHKVAKYAQVSLLKALIYGSEKRSKKR